MRTTFSVLNNNDYTMVWLLAPMLHDSTHAVGVCMHDSLFQKSIYACSDSAMLMHLLMQNGVCLYFQAS